MYCKHTVSVKSPNRVVVYASAVLEKILDRHERSRIAAQWNGRGGGVHAYVCKIRSKYNMWFKSYEYFH